MRVPSRVKTGVPLAAAGAECGPVTVPLDYADPGGRTIEIAVSRVRATGTGDRRGLLLANPGGPGGAGLDYPLFCARRWATSPTATTSSASIPAPSATAHL